MCGVEKPYAARSFSTPVKSPLLMSPELTSPTPPSPSLCHLPAYRAADLVRRRDISCHELVKSHLDRITHRDADIRAWAHLDPEATLRQAKRKDAQECVGSLHGVPVAVKDLIDTKDMRTTYGSAIYSDHVPCRNASCVARLLAAGAVILGKTVTTEFATFQPAATRNPAAPGRTPGGSSSGSAAAVADYMAPVALGTQTAGSIMRPAAYCGIYGFKPSYGALSYGGIKALSPSLDTVGFFARAAQDLSLLWDALGTPLQGARVADLPVGRGDAIRLGIAHVPESDRADDDVHDAIESVAQAVADECDVRRLTLAGAFASAVSAHKIIMTVEAAAALGPEYREHRLELGPQVLELIEGGRRLSRGTYERALKVRDSCLTELASISLRYDALLVPGVTGEAPVGLGFTGDPLFCRTWSLIGCPAASLPVAHGPSGAPIGVQIVGAPGRDHDLLNVVAHIVPMLMGTGMDMRSSPTSSPPSGASDALSRSHRSREGHSDP